MIREAGATPVFFLTWAHRDGWPENGMDDYSSMQEAIDDGYLAIAREQNAAVAPVGYAWWALLHQDPEAALWQNDGSHPTVEGTYLAACVFYQPSSDRVRKGSTITPACQMPRLRACRRSRRTSSSATPRPGDCASLSPPEFRRLAATSADLDLREAVRLERRDDLAVAERLPR